MTTDDLIKSVDRKLELLLKDKDELKKIILGDQGNGGLVDDVRDIKRELVGDPHLKREGLIQMVQKHDEYLNKMKNMTTFSLAMISIGAAVGGFLTWVTSNVSVVKKMFS